MDILSARKKAAERAKAKKKAAPEQPPAPAAPPEEAHPQAAGEQPPVEAAAPPEPAVTPPEAAPAESLPEAETAEAGPHEVEMLAFRLGPEEYAVAIEQVREVTRLWDITPVPNSPPYVLGVTSLRGTVLPVIDLCKRLGIPAGARDEKARIVVLSQSDENTGIVADSVSGVVRLPEDEIKPAPETIEQGAEYLRGIVRKGEKLYILLDLEKAAAM